MGLILGDEAKGEAPVVLTDILGSEDALGDMDFKIAGDAEGLTAFQLDIKVEGITLPVMRTALESARVGLIHILGEMEKADPPPGGEMSKYAPQIETLTVSKKYIGRVIGKGGEQIKSICEQTKIDTIDINDDGVVVLSGGFGCDMASAVAIVESLTVEAEVGKTYRGARVTKVLDFGAFVEVLPGIEGLCHVSELDVTRVNNPKDVVNEGDRIDVKLLETNERGQLKLSRREVLLDEGGDEARAQLEEAKQAREEARDARKAEAEGGRSLRAAAGARIAGGGTRTTEGAAGRRRRRGAGEPDSASEGVDTGFRNGFILRVLSYFYFSLDVTSAPPRVESVGRASGARANVGKTAIATVLSHSPYRRFPESFFSIASLWLFCDTFCFFALGFEGDGLVAGISDSAVTSGGGDHAFSSRRLRFPAVASSPASSDCSACSSDSASSDSARSFPSLPASPPSRKPRAFFGFLRAGFGAGSKLGDREDVSLSPPPSSSSTVAAASESDAERSDAGAVCARFSSGAGDASAAVLFGFLPFSPTCSGWKGHDLQNRKWSVGVKPRSAHV